MYKFWELVDSVDRPTNVKRQTPVLWRDPLRYRYGRGTSGVPSWLVLGAVHALEGPAYLLIRVSSRFHCLAPWKPFSFSQMEFISSLLYFTLSGSSPTTVALLCADLEASRLPQVSTDVWRWLGCNHVTFSHFPESFPTLWFVSVVKPTRHKLWMWVLIHIGNEN